MKYKLLALVILGISLCANVVIGFIVARQDSMVQSVLGVEDQEKKYPYLSKRILREFPQDVLINFLELRQQLQIETDPYGDTFGLYFEYLPTGTSIAINANTEFYGASLIKVPLVMGYYHMRERTKLQGDPLLEIQKEQINKEFGDLWKKGAGYKIRASEAVKLALIESDNTAVNLLIPFITTEDFDKVYESLDIDFRTDPNGAVISAKNYASILKALYFSSVLSKESSQEILDMLTKTKFPDKLQAGVPQNITVAHKIGDFVGKNGEVGYRDCGIVYIPKRPYLLCMFSKTDEQTARERMQAVSVQVYRYVQEKNLL